MYVCLVFIYVCLVFIYVWVSILFSFRVCCKFLGIARVVAHCQGWGSFLLLCPGKFRFLGKKILKEKVLNITVVTRGLFVIQYRDAVVIILMRLSNCSVKYHICMHYFIMLGILLGD